VDSPPSSGSQSPAQLMALCHALLLHAQETYHYHSVCTEAKVRKQEEQEKNEASSFTPHQQQQKQQAKINEMKKKELVKSPRILASCVTLGTKLLFERRIRKTLKKVKEWIRMSPNSHNDNLVVEAILVHI
jgi:hypothetical protein